MWNSLLVLDDFLILDVTHDLFVQVYIICDLEIQKHELYMMTEWAKTRTH
jgi:hypothetical protein